MPGMAAQSIMDGLYERHAAGCRRGYDGHSLKEKAPDLKSCDS